MITASVYLYGCTAGSSASCCPKKAETAVTCNKFTVTNLAVVLFFSLTSIVVSIIGFAALPSTVGSFNMHLVYALLLGDGLAGILWSILGAGTCGGLTVQLKGEGALNRFLKC